MLSLKIHSPKELLKLQLESLSVTYGQEYLYKYIVNESKFNNDLSIHLHNLVLSFDDGILQAALKEHFANFMEQRGWARLLKDIFNY